MEEAVDNGKYCQNYQQLLVYLISKLSKLFNVYILVYDEEDFLQGSVLNHGRIFVFPLLDYLRPRGKTPTTKHSF